MSVLSPSKAVLANYYESLHKLPGVTDVTTKADGLHIATKSERDSKFLDSLLEDSINGVAVHFDAAPAVPKPPKAHKPRKPSTGPKPGPKKPELSPAEKAAKRYGKALSAIEHVTGISADPSGRVVVQVDDPASIKYVDDLVEDTLNGVLVAFESPKPTAG